MELTERERAVLGLIEQNPLVSQGELAGLLGITRSSVAGHVMRLTEKGAIRGRGYVLNAAPYVAVVGGANVDIQARSSARLVPAESNPGTVTRSAGGVARNIAEGVARSGIDVRLISAFGDDDHGRWLHATTTAAGVDLGSSVWSTQSTATYLAVLDAEGELVAAVNDMAIIDEIDADVIGRAAADLAHADAVVLDCNLSSSAIEAVSRYTDALFVDPVSAVKAARIEPVLDRVHTVKPNRAELSVLTGMPTEEFSDVEAAANLLLARGPRRVVVSLGSDGVVCATGDSIDVIPPRELVGELVSVTGAGDAMMAGLVAAHVDGLGGHDAIRVALDRATEAIAVADAVPTVALRRRSVG